MSMSDCFRVEDWPRFIHAEQKFNDIQVGDIPKHMYDRFDELAKGRDLCGKRIAITVGSRGIVNLDLIVKETVSNLKRLGAIPFIIPAMGSHGGAVAEGQTKTINLLGITEEAMGAPIVSSMDVEIIGHTELGLPVYVAKDALEADGIVVLNRVKMHTSFRGDYESGILKMMVVGLGKHQGALTLHGAGFERMGENIKDIATVMLNKIKILCGIAIVENAYEKTAEVAVIPAERILEEEPKLLRLSKSLMPRIPYDEVDILILRQVGKDISGDGMDPNITGRYTPHTMKPDYSFIPRITRVVALDLTEASHGSAIGMGHLDAIPQKFRDKINFDITYMNAVTATVTNTCKMPIVTPDVRGAIEVAARTSQVLNPKDLKICIVQDTLHLGNMIVSEPLYNNELKQCSVTYHGDFMDMKFDENGDLLL